MAEQDENDAAVASASVAPVPDDGVDAVTAAFARLMSGERAIDDDELLLAGVVELLGAGGRTAAELLEGLRNTWPGAALTMLQVVQVLERAEHASLVLRAAGIAGSELWALTHDGQQELALTRSWRDDLRRRFERQVRDAATDAFGADPGQERAQSWATVLEAALRQGLLQSGSGYDGQVATLDGRTLVPRSVDVAAIRAQLSMGTSTEAREFLFGCVEAALDPGDPFAAELVTLLIVGFVLHATVARLDRADASRRVGSIAGQKAVLDTPSLYGLLGGRRRRESVEAVIRAAVAAGVEVIVLDHTLQELVASLEQLRVTQLPPDYTTWSPERFDAFGQLVDSNILATYVEAAREGRYESWDAFERAAEGARAMLGQLGAVCRPHGNHDPETVERCRAALAGVIASRSPGRRRASANIDRDADTLAMVWRARRNELPGSSWPGAWVITPDTCLSPAMATLEPSARWPFTLTLAQLAAVVTRCAGVPDVAELTRAAAALVTYDTADALACRYPAQVAAELARALIGEQAGTRADVRIAQGGLGGVLCEADTLDPTEVTRRVLARRNRRMVLANDSYTASVRAQAVAADDQRRAREAELAAAREGARHRERELQEQLSQAQKESQQRAERLAEQERQAAVATDRRRRERRRDVVAGVHLLAVVLLAVFGLWVQAALVAVSLVLLWFRLRAWARDGDEALMSVLIGAVPDFLGVAAWLWSALKG